MADQNKTILNGEYIEELEVNGHKASVEIAKRDALGHIIDKFYLPIARAQEKLIDGVNIAKINNTSLLTNTNFQLYTKTEVYNKNEIDYYLNNKISLSAVSALPNNNDARSNVLYLLTLDQSLWIYNSGSWVRVGISLPAVPVDSGKYALVCTVSNSGTIQYSWDNAVNIGTDTPDPDQPVVVEHHLVSIYIQTRPRKLVYEIGDVFSLDGIGVKAVYTDSDDDIIITNDIVLETVPNMEQAGEQTVIISYTDENNEYAETSFKITINEPIVEVGDLDDGSNEHIITFGVSENKDGQSINNGTAIQSDRYYSVNSEFALNNCGLTAGQSISGLSTYGLKLGSSSKNGIFTISFDNDDEYIVQTIHIYGHLYNTNTTKIKIAYGSNEQEYKCNIGDTNETTGDASNIDAETEIHDMKFSIGSDINSITISTTNKRAYITAVKITTNDK